MHAYARKYVSLLTCVACAWICRLCPAAPATQPADVDQQPSVKRPVPQAVAPPSRQTFRIYVLMGQSNMVGRDTRTIGTQQDDPRILAFDVTGGWVVAHEPMHLRGSGIGPGISFAHEMLKADPNLVIGLVPCAVGNTSLRRWSKGNDLYEQAVKKTRIAAQFGVLSGVLWHQGEADSSKPERATTYGSRLTQMVEDLRHDLGRPNLPLVVGQIGPFLNPEKFKFADTVRAAIKDVSVHVPNVGFADSAGLKDKGDRVHFDAASQIEFGARYAKAMQGLNN